MSLPINRPMNRLVTTRCSSSSPNPAPVNPSNLTQKALRINNRTSRYFSTRQKSEQQQPISKFYDEFKKLHRDLRAVENVTEAVCEDGKSTLQQAFVGLDGVLDEVMQILPHEPVIVPAAAPTEAKRSERGRSPSAERRLVWPMTKMKTATILASVERYKSSINKVLAAEGLTKTAAVARDLEKLLIMAKGVEASYEIKTTGESRLAELARTEGELKLFLLPLETEAAVRATQGHLQNLVEWEGAIMQQQLADVRKKNKRLGEVARIGPMYPSPHIRLLETEAYESWIKNPQVSLFVLGSDATGKTAFANEIVQELPEFLNQSEIVISYFLQLRERERPDVSEILRTLAVQTAHRSAAAKRVALEFVKNNTKNGKLIVGLPALQNLIVKMSETFKRVVIVLDGLDEPPDRHRKDLSYLLELPRVSRTIQMIAFGRWQPQNQESFRTIDVANVFQESVHGIVQDKLRDLKVDFRAQDISEILGIVTKRFGMQGLIGYRFAFEFLRSFLLSSGSHHTVDQVKAKIKEIFIGSLVTPWTRIR